MDFLKKLCSSKKRVACIVVALVALLLLILYAANALGGLDTFGQNLVLDIRASRLTDFFKVMTMFLNPYIIFLLVVFVAAFGPGNHPGFCLFLDVAGAFLINEVLKTLCQRTRPLGHALITETGFSFPSGHAVVAMALFGFIIWLVWHHLKNRPLWRWFLVLIFSGIIGAIGISRVYLGVHWTSDVLEGWCVGFLWLAFFTGVCAPRLQRARRLLAGTELDATDGAAGNAAFRASRRAWRKQLRKTKKTPSADSSVVGQDTVHGDALRDGASPVDRAHRDTEHSSQAAVNNSESIKGESHGVSGTR